MPDGGNANDETNSNPFNRRHQHSQFLASWLQQASEVLKKEKKQIKKKHKKLLLL
jgi:hypothetical protein